MKVVLTVTLDLPEHFESFSDAELRQSLWEEYIKVVPGNHLQQAASCVAYLNDPNSRVRIINEAARRDYKMWAKITHDPVWNFERVIKVEET